MYFFLKHFALPFVNRKIQRVVGGERLPNDGGYILAINHVSWLDPIYVAAAFFRYAKKRLVFLAATKKSLWTGGVIPITKHNPTVCLEHAARRVQRGEVVGIFPFGDQRKPHERPKTGAARIAYVTGRPIVPTLLQNLPSGHTWKMLAQFPFVRRRVEVQFGQPIFLTPPQELSRDVLYTDMERIHSALRTLEHQWPTP